MHPVDRAILEFCQDEFRPLKPLRDRIPGGTLYRHANRLQKWGWLERQTGFYRSTQVGLRQLAEALGGRQWNGLDELYPPLALIPTPVHRAMAELMLAAAVARQHAVRADRHPFFVAVGSTLRWKTSLGRFCCFALGLDPTLHIVDCANEAGRSLSVRRGSTGALVFKRELLDAPFVVLDEFLNADASLRASLNLFLSGSLVVPFENDQLVVKPVALLALNPRPKQTLEEQLGLSTPLIRRAIIANFDIVPTPDLAATGDQALTAAQAHPPLTLPAPAVDCQAHLQRIVECLRTILIPEAHERVDVNAVINLCTGMTALIPDATEAVAQVLHGIGLCAETMGWAQPGWIEPVTHFTLTARPRRASEAMTPTRPADFPERSVSKETHATSPAVSLQIPRSARETGLPNLALSDELKGQLVWLTVETGRPLDETLRVLVEFYVQSRQRGSTLEMLRHCLLIARQLRINEIDVVTLRNYFAAHTMLKKYRCGFEDVPEALQLIELLSFLPEPWNWDQAREVIKAAAILIRHGISADEVGRFLIRNRQLEELGFDEETANAIAQELKRAGAVGRRREDVLRQMIAQAGQQVDLEALEHQTKDLQAKVTALEVERNRLFEAVGQVETRLGQLRKAETAAQQREKTLSDEAEAHESDLAALRAFRAFLLRKTAPVDAFWADLERLKQYREGNARPGSKYAELYTDCVRDQVFSLFQGLSEEAQASELSDA